VDRLARCAHARERTAAAYPIIPGVLRRWSPHSEPALVDAGAGAGPSRVSLAGTHGARVRSILSRGTWTLIGWDIPPWTGDSSSVQDGDFDVGKLEMAASSIRGNQVPEDAGSTAPSFKAQKIYHQVSSAEKVEAEPVHPF